MTEARNHKNASLVYSWASSQLSRTPPRTSADMCAVTTPARVSFARTRTDALSAACACCAACASRCGCAPFQLSKEPNLFFWMQANHSDGSWSSGIYGPSLFVAVLMLISAILFKAWQLSKKPNTILYDLRE